MIARSQAARVGEGQGTLEAAAKGSSEVVANIVSGGRYGTVANIYENVRAYNAGENQLEELDYN